MQSCRCSKQIHVSRLTCLLDWHRFESYPKRKYHDVLHPVSCSVLCFLVPTPCHVFTLYSSARSLQLTTLQIQGISDQSFFSSYHYKWDSRGEEEEEDSKTVQSCLQSSSDLIMICTQLFEKLHRHLHRWEAVPKPIAVPCLTLKTSDSNKHFIG